MFHQRFFKVIMMKNAISGAQGLFSIFSFAETLPSMDQMITKFIEKLLPKSLVSLTQVKIN
jgi:hypothetical protein